MNATRIYPDWTAFALTLLVVSLQAPKTFAELREALGGFIAFAICLRQALEQSPASA